VPAKFSGIAHLPHDPGPEGLPSVATIQPEGIIGVLCIPDYAPSILYIRQICIGPGLRILLQANFRELSFFGSRVNKGKDEQEGQRMPILPASY